MSPPEKITTSIFNQVDRAPLAGKFLIRDTVKSYIEAPADKEKKRFIGVNALLGVMVLAHSLQAVEGGALLTSHAERFYDHSNPVDLTIAGIDGIYAVVNTVVAARQSALIPRMNQIRVRRKNHQGEINTKTLVDDYATKGSDTSTNLESTNEAEKRRNKAMRNAVAITLAGQALFVGTANIYGVNDASSGPEYNVTSDSVLSHGSLPLESGKVVINPNTSPSP